MSTIDSLQTELDHNVVDLKSKALVPLQTFEMGFYSVLLLAVCRANDGCLYVFDLEQNKRTLKVSVCA